MQDFTLDPEQMVAATAAMHIARKMARQAQNAVENGKPEPPYTPEITYLAGGRHYRMRVNPDMTTTISEA